MAKGAGGWKAWPLFLRSLLVFLHLDLLRTQSSDMTSFFLLVQGRALLPLTLEILALY